MATTFFPALHLPEWTVTAVVAACVLGFPIALVLAWAFDITDHGIVRAEEDAPARAPSRRFRWVVLGVVLFATTAIAVGLVARRDDVATAADTELIAVFPFSGSVAPSLEYLHEGLVHLLAATIESVGGSRVVHPRTAMAAWQRSFGSEFRNVPPDSARAVASRLGAGRFLLGAISVRRAA